MVKYNRRTRDKWRLRRDGCRCCASALLAALLPLLAGAAAETDLAFILSPDQVVPPTASMASGRAIATLSADETRVVFVIEHSVVNPIAVTVHQAGRGVDGPVVHTLGTAMSPVVDTWYLSAADVTALESGQLYVSISSTAYPDGEVRGQIDVNPDPQPGDVIITEIMYNPASFEDSAVPEPEWIELFNTTETDIEIGGWYFQDEDVTGAAPCTPLRGGTFPPFVLRSFEVVVVIPDGAGALRPTVADFKTAWGLGPTTNVLQLNADGTSGGALVAGGLSNQPNEDGNPANDLPLVSSAWKPCNPAGATRVDNEILTLSDGGQIIDVVNFGSGPLFASPTSWPPDTSNGSIALVPGDYPTSPPNDFSTYTAAANDIGINWIAHQIGDVAGGVRQVAAAGVYGGGDVGSPGYLFGATSGNRAPVAFSNAYPAVPGGTTNITLTGADTTRPFFGLLLFVIKSLPAHGTLTDTTNGHLLTPSDVTGFGYIIPRPPFNTLRYVNDGTCTADGFTFTAYDGLLESPVTRIDLLVQCGGVAITEIMYDPNSAENADGPAEWIELYNYGAMPIDLAGWYLTDGVSRSGTFPPFVLGAAATAVVIPRSVDPAEFSDAWCTSATHVPPCPHNALVLSADGPRRVAPGELITVTLSQADLLEPVRGVQVFAEFDDQRLTHLATELETCGGACPPDLRTPYNLAILNQVSNGQITLALGVDDANGQTPTQADAPLATYTFEAGPQEGAASVRFRDTLPPTRFSDAAGGAVDPCLRDTRRIWIDATPDACPDNVLEFRLAPGSSRVLPGERVIVELYQRELAQPVRGYQVFADFDSSMLTHVATRMESCAGVCPPDLRGPYNLVLVNSVSGDHIDLAAGIDDFQGQLPTQADALLATLEFEAGATPGLTSIDFRVHQPPTRFANIDGFEVLPCRVDSPAITIEPGPASVGCPLVQATTNGLLGTQGVIGADLGNASGVVRLHAPDVLVDAVAYRRGEIDPAWPPLPLDGPSIYVLPGAGYDAYANDAPGAWGASVGDVHGAYEVYPTPTFDGLDTGSPAYLAGVAQGACSTGGPLFDGNQDGAIDLVDFAHFVHCHRGPAALPPLNCGCFDWDFDGDIDLLDAAPLQQAF